MKFKGATKGDLILIVVLIVIGVGALLYNQIIVPRRGRGMNVLIEIEGQVVQELSLLRDSQEIRFETERGFNVVEVKNGKVRVSDADCPDKICVNTGWREHVGQVIVCMPHHFVVRIEGSADSPLDLDSYTY